MKKLGLIILLFTFVLCGFSPSFAQGNHPPRVVDTASVLTTEQRDELEGKLDKLSKKNNCDIAILTMDSLGGLDPYDVATKYYDSNGYGLGENKDGILFLLGMDHTWAISTNSFCKKAFTDDGNMYIMDIVTPMLKDGDFYGAFDEFASLADEFIIQAKTGKPYDNSNLPKPPVPRIWKIAAPVIGFLLASMVAFYKKEKSKTVKEAFGAKEYAIEGSLNLTLNEDRFIRTFTTSRKIKDDDDDSFTSHNSDSGSHGGASGTW